MRTHIGEAGLLDILEGTSEAGRGHLEGCPECRSRLEEARAGRDLALQAEVPEPSLLYWESLRRQVSRGLDAEAARPKAWWRAGWLAPAVAAAALLVGIVTFVPVAPPPPVPVAETPLPAWSALPPAEDDAGLEVLRAVAPAVADVPGAACEGMAECVAFLSDEESQALADHLRREMVAGKPL